MNIYDYPKFAEALCQNGPIVFLCGAGLSISLGDHAEGWVNWIRRSKTYMSTAEADTLEKKIGSFSASELINAASYCLSTLKTNGTYTAFMDSTIGNLALKNHSLANALALLARCGDIFATTNYDRLIESATGIDYLSYDTPGEILRMLQSQRKNSVIHLHGVYDPIVGKDNIVADQAQYDDVLQNQGAQFIQNLLSSSTLIMLGCGATVDDPNLKGFMSFAAEQLKLNIPYFYLYRDGDNISDLQPNVTPVCYGSAHTDFPAAMEQIANFRIRFRYRDTGIIKVNPYIRNRTTAAASYRMHYLNAFSKFIGRQAELDQLNKFCQSNQPIQWWALVGEGGIGKSRLVYQWLQNLPNNWFGFFASISENTDAFQRFQPFSNTVMVFDYVLGNENQCAQVLTVLLDKFEFSQFQLRILLIDRRYGNTAYSWYDRMIHSMDMQHQLVFQEYLYNSKPGLSPLQISALSEAEEIEFVSSYLTSYLSQVADAAVKRKYESQIRPTAEQIHKNFHEALRSEYDRPLFLAIYTELWIYKDGDVSISDLDEMLSEFLSREEDRWISILGNSKELLNDYVKALALASATDMVCFKDDNGAYQPAIERLQQFLFTSQRPGKKQPDYSELFIYQEFARDFSMDLKDPDAIHEEVLRRRSDPSYLLRDENGRPILLTILEPLYPDIIKEFLVDYYVPEQEWDVFAHAARMGTTTEFDLFLSHAIDDFPDKTSYMAMEFSPLEDERDRFGQYIFVLIRMRDLDNFEQIADTLCSSSLREPFLVYELEAWRRMAVVLEERKNFQRMHRISLKCLEYLLARLDSKIVQDSAPEIMESFYIGFHNAEETELAADYLEHCNSIAESIPEDGYIATQCIAFFAQQMILWMREDNKRSISYCWEQIMKFQRRFPDDTDNLDYIADCSEPLYDYYAEHNLPGRKRRLLHNIEEIYDQTPYVDIADILAVMEANEHAAYEPPQYTDPHKAEYLASAEERIKQLYEQFPDEEQVVLGYAYLRSYNYISWLDFPRPIDEQLIPLFRSWLEKYPDSTLELGERYGYILFEKWLYLASTEDINGANAVYSELRQLEAKLSKEYPDEENGLKCIFEQNHIWQL